MDFQLATRLVGLSDKCPFKEFFGDSLPGGIGSDILTASIDEQKRRRMGTHRSKKDQLAKQVGDRWISFQMALSNKRKYKQQSSRHSPQVYEDMFKSSPVIH